MDRPSPTGGRRPGGGERGKLGPRDGTPAKLQTGLQFLTKDFLRLWMVDIRWEGRAKHKVHAPDWRGQKLRLGPRRGEGALHPGRVRPSSSWMPELLRPQKAQNAGAAKSALLWRTRKLEPHATQGLLHIEQPGA